MVKSSDHNVRLNPNIDNRKTVAIRKFKLHQSPQRLRKKKTKRSQTGSASRSAHCGRRRR
jgi:hypothetical protein